MKVGVLGSGDVGQTLAKGFAARGHEVRLGTRDPGSERLRAWSASVQGHLSLGNFREAAEFGDFLVLSVHGAAAEEVLASIGPAAFAGKVVIDTTNPLVFPEGKPPSLFVGLTDSLGERIQRKIPSARVVKAFNTVSSVQMVDPRIAGGPPEMLICGNDPSAKATVARIVQDFGWPGVLDLGGIEECRWIEPMVPLWVRIGSKLGTWEHVLKVVRP
ncbi:MAG: NAD(P)-binding domain-containing protein [Candidatus Thermoplasmatota archaeon]|jgi:predicted dinucleotide-binding enzyme|nr:NAD(P)-binding domain-containing protein [Candidatus Thermoplasmatota archaeon]